MHVGRVRTYVPYITAFPSIYSATKVDEARAKLSLAGHATYYMV